METKRIVIRADGNQQIAMGHVMRCLSIADELRESGAEVIFVTAGNETEELIRGRGFENYVLHSDFDRMEQELPVLLDFLKEYRPDLILTDSYYVTGAYMEALRRICKTAYIDDLGQPVYPVDILINYNIYGSELPYQKYYEEKGISLPERILTGCTYAPLRAEFRQGRRSRIQERVTDILITTGGGDKENTSGKLCRKLLAERKEGHHAGIRYHVICGPFAQNRQELMEIASVDDAFVIRGFVTNMSEFLIDFDLAVSAGGSTMYELCSMGLPTVCFTFADNQRLQAECFDRTTEVKNAGSMADRPEETVDRIAERLTQLEQDNALRQTVREQMLGLVDGRGAIRIAEALSL